MHDELKSKFKTRARDSFRNPLARSFASTVLTNLPALSCASASACMAFMINVLLIEIVMSAEPFKVAANSSRIIALSSVPREKGVGILSLRRKHVKGNKNL